MLGNEGKVQTGEASLTLDWLNGVEMIVAVVCLLAKFRGRVDSAISQSGYHSGVMG
jgi:hypothetical protein